MWQTRESGRLLTGCKMSTLKNNTKITKLTFDDKIYLSLSSGDVLAIPYNYTKKLAKATKDELATYRLIADGIGVHFQTINEDISLRGIVRYKMENELLAS